MATKTKTLKPYYTRSGVQLYQGCCIEVLQHLIAAGQADFDLVFADPPFNIGQKYDGHDDNEDQEQYVDWTDQWFQLAWQATSDKGLLAVHCPDAVALQLVCYEPPELLHWILWHYRFAQARKVENARSCLNSREHLLVFGYDDVETTFNAPTVPSDRATKYSDKRTTTTSSPGMRVAFNIWGLPEDGDCWGRVQGNSAERWDKVHGAMVDHPNQLPEKYVARAIETFSNPGDRILVPFSGSGTELVVGRALGREMIGIEKGKRECQSIVRRLKRGPVRIGE